MSVIPTSLIDAQTEALNTVSNAVKKLVREFLATVQYSSTDELFALLLEFLQPLLGEATDLAAAYAAEAYDVIRSASVGSSLGATAYSGREAEATEAVIRSFMQKILEGKYDQFVNLVLERVDYEIKKAAAESTFHNADNDNLKPRFARVPTGAETCPFCIMLASRGFVYHSRASAGELNHFHANCDCRVVAGFPGMRVDGYDPDALYDQYLDDLKSGKLKLNTVSKSTGGGKEWTSKEFNSVGDFVGFIQEATDIDDLQQRCAIVEQEFRNTTLSDRYYDNIRAAVQEMKRKLLRPVA